MSYLAVAQIARNPVIADRVTACAATLGVPDPQSFAFVNAWSLAAVEGWAEAWSTSELDDPGADPEAITDAMILHAVQAVNGQEATP